MRKILGSTLTVGLILVGGAARAQMSAENKPATQVAQAPNMRATVLEDLKILQKKYVDLAGVIPAEKYTWRPGAGVRSVSEVFLHVAGASYGFPSVWGASPPEGFDRKGLETSTTDKAQVIERLNQSFEHARQAVEKVSNADLQRPVKLFGRDMTVSTVMFIMAGHAHEHLGQSIAYARVNGIVPPWNAGPQARE